MSSNKNNQSNRVEMNDVITFEKVVKFDLTFKKFRETVNFPSERMYGEVWEKIVARVNKKKYNKFSYNCDIDDVEEEQECSSIQDLVDAAVRDAYDEAKDEYLERREANIKKGLEEEDKPEKRKISKEKDRKDVSVIDFVELYAKYPFMVPKSVLIKYTEAKKMGANDRKAFLNRITREKKREGSSEFSAAENQATLDRFDTQLEKEYKNWLDGGDNNRYDDEEVAEYRRKNK